MTRPGVEVTTIANPTPATVPTDTSVFFVVGVTATKAAPQLVHSLEEFTAVYGARTGPSAAVYDAVDSFFQEGGGECWVSPANSSSQADVQAALDLLDVGKGPGQVAVPGITTQAIHSAVLAHCQSHNRVALLDVAAGATKSAMLAQATALASDANASYGALFGPSCEIPGIAGGTTRQAGWAGIEAGIIARNDATMNPDIAAAGDNGVSAFALSLDGSFADQDYEDLNDGSVCMARNKYGRIECYGFRSLSTDPDWVQFGFARLRMAIQAQAEAIGEAYVFSQIDGRGVTLSKFAGDLSAMLAGFYQAGALYGDTAGEAFQVKVGPPINTDETIANGELHAELLVKMSPFAELVVIQIVKVAITQQLVTA